MTRIATLLLLILAVSDSFYPLAAQTVGSEEKPQALYQITVTSRSTKAINYRVNTSTKVDFRGTPLMPDTEGEAEIRSRDGYVEVKAELKNLQSPTRFGTEYLTYVLWAVTPEGRAISLGEVRPENGRAKLQVTSKMQTFGMIVTAEPYFAVTMPSNVVVLENIPRRDTKGMQTEIDAKFELIERGQYVTEANPEDLKPLPQDSKTPFDVVQARNAIRLARIAKADKYAASSFRRATELMDRTEDYVVREQWKPSETTSRQVTQAAEDARTIALKRREEERIALQQEAERQRTEEARQRAAEAKQMAAEQEQMRKDAEERQRQAEQQKLMAQLEAERSARQRAEAQAAQAAARAAEEAARRQAELSGQQAEAANQREAIARQDAEKARAEAQALRNRLVDQLNRVLVTQDTPRGLVVTMSDILFDVGKFDLKPGTREALAKIAGILTWTPGLTLEVEGHTDSTGSDELNRKLSEQRAAAVLNYLVDQGVPPLSNITGRGYASSRPVAGNDTRDGRQRNRRVELVISGDIIGVPLGGTQTTTF
ncbi:MAG: OmpA family protein [Bryobacterales bacterium]|nr:OmpA family protein [Bryobacterales bacterium]